MCCDSVAFGVSLNSRDDFEQLSRGKDAAKRAFEEQSGRSFAERRAALLEGNAFSAFVENVRSKGFFDGLEEDSVEYLERYERMMDKYEARLASSSSSSSSKREEEEKKGASEAEAKEEKKKGDNAVRSQNFEAAVEHYTVAIGMVENNGDLQSMLSVLLANRAAAETHLRQFEEALRDCERSCELNPEYVKAWSRRGEVEGSCVRLKRMTVVAGA